MSAFFMSFKTLIGRVRLLRSKKVKHARKIYFISSNTVLPPPMTKEEERSCLERLACGEEEAREDLIIHNLRLVVYIAKKFESAAVSAEDLISIGTIGLIKAVKTFCPDKNIKLATYASRCVENEILMYLRKLSNRGSEISLDEPLNVDWDGNELLLGDVLSTEADIVSAGIETSDEKKLLLSCIEKLDIRDATIIRMRFGIGLPREYTQKEVADALGISQSYISRIEKKIFKRLRQLIEKEYIQQ